MTSGSLNQDLIQDITFLETFGYLIAAGLTIAAYNYLLQLGHEIEFIWARKFSMTGLAYITLRYIGVLWVISVAVGAVAHKLSRNESSYVICYILKVIVDEASYTVVMFFLQGMMALRIYILFRQSRKLLYLLLPLFSVVQMVNGISLVMYLQPGAQQGFNETVAGFDTCVLTFARKAIWISPSSGALQLAFEFIMLVLVLYYVYCHLDRPFWRSPARSMNIMVSVIIRDNLIYFLVCFVTLLCPSFIDGPSRSMNAAYLIFSEFIMVGVVGPWMILSLRSEHKHSLGEGQSHATELSTLNFTSSISPPAIKERDIG